MSDVIISRSMYRPTVDVGVLAIARVSQGMSAAWQLSIMHVVKLTRGNQQRGITLLSASAWPTSINSITATAD